MKNILITIVTLVLAGVVGFLAVQHYDSYQQQRARAAAEQRGQEFKKAEELKKVKSDRDSAVKEAESVRKECQKGIEAYNLLSTANKNKIDPITCDWLPTLTHRYPRLYIPLLGGIFNIEPNKKQKG